MNSSVAVPSSERVPNGSPHVSASTSSQDSSSAQALSDFVQVEHKRPRLKRQAPPDSPTTESSNRFAPLMDCEEVAATPTPNKKSAPTPLIISGHPRNTTQFIAEIKENTEGKFHIKYTKHNTNLYFLNQSDKLKYENVIRNKNTQYYTYTDRSEKQHGFVMKGLETDLSVEEILAELKSECLEIIKVYKMKTTRPCFLVIASNKIKLKDVEKIKYVSYTKVTWEHHVNKKRIIQCHRCQRWGHATANCNMRVRCLKCAGDHATSSCTKANDTAGSCANCEGAHIANSVSCPVYVARMRQLQANRGRRAPPLQRTPAPAQAQYVAAPPPTFNVWHQREANRKQMAVPNVPTATQQQLTSRPTPPMSFAQAASSNNNVGDLLAEMGKLNNQINIAELIRALRDLNSLLAQATTSSDRFMVTLTFTQNLSQYQI